LGGAAGTGGGGPLTDPSRAWWLIGGVPKAKGFCRGCGSEAGPRCINFGLTPLGGPAIFFGGIAGTAKVALGPLFTTGSFGVAALTIPDLGMGALELCATLFLGGRTAPVL